MERSTRNVDTRLEAVADPGIVRYDTSVRYTNNGTGTLQGVLIPSVIWFDVGSFPSIVLDPGESENREIHIDRSSDPTHPRRSGPWRAS